MKHMIKMLGLSLAAVLAFAALSAAGASASQPEFEAAEGFPVTFTGTGGAGQLETTPESGKVRTINCTGNTSAGTINSSTSVTNIKVTFTGCTASGPFGTSVSCRTPGSPNPGEIITNVSKGQLVYYEAKSSNTALLVEPAEGAEFAKVNCGGVQEIRVTGKVLGKLTPVNAEFGKKFTLTFTQTEGVQSPKTYLDPVDCGAVTAHLNAQGIKLGFFTGENWAARESGIEGTGEVTTSSNVRINASECT